MKRLLAATPSGCCCNRLRLLGFPKEQMGSGVDEKSDIYDVKSYSDHYVCDDVPELSVCDACFQDGRYDVNHLAAADVMKGCRRF
jgi:hypothetical protein